MEGAPPRDEGQILRAKSARTIAAVGPIATLRGRWGAFGAAPGLKLAGCPLPR